MKQNMPLVSVIVPVYNGERFLQETIDSIINQSYKNLEIIIVDDASTDASREIIDAYQDDRIKKIYKDKNENICCASNEAFECAKGEYCALIGHDDVWYFDKIEKQVNFMESNSAYNVCFTRCNIIDQNNQIIDEQHLLNDIFNLYKNQEREAHIYQLYVEGNRFCAPSALIRREDLNKVGFYDNSLLQLQDYELWLRLLTLSNLYILDEKLLAYRQILDTNTNLSSISPTTLMRGDHEFHYIREKYLYDLSDELYKTVFSEQLIKKESLSKEDFKCERMLFMKRMNNPYWTKRCSELLNDSNLRYRLDTEYGFTVQDFYQCNKETIFYERLNQSQNAGSESGISAESFLEYMDVFIAAHKIDYAIELLLKLQHAVCGNERTKVMCKMFEIYSAEKRAGEPAIFNSINSVQESLDCYEALRFNIKACETDVNVSLDSIIDYLIVNNISSTAVCYVIEHEIDDKSVVLNKIAMAFFDNGNQLLAVRLLKWGYFNLKDDLTLFNFAFVLYCTGEYDVAMQMANQITIDNDAVSELRGIIKKKNNKIRVAFLIQVLEIWDKQAPVFEMMRKNPMFDVSVILVPAVDLINWRLHPYGDEEEFLKERYPGVKIIKVIDNGQVYHIKKYEYDYVFYQRPYDHYLPGPLQSSAVGEKAKICYVPYGYQGANVFMEGNTQEEFFKNVYMSFLESEEIQNVLFEKFRDEVQSGRKKLYNLGYPVFDTYLHLQNSKEKTIMWTPRWSFDPIIGGSHYVDYKDEFVSLKEKYPERDIMIRPHPLMWENAVKEGVMTQEEVAQYKLLLKEKGIAIDGNKMIEDSIKNAKVLITDFSTIIITYFMTGKPIIYCPYEVELNEMYQKLLPGMYVANSWDDVERYIDMIERGEDELYSIRQEIIEKELRYLSGGTEKIVETIINDYNNV